MSLPSSGTITMGMIRTELKQTGAISLGSSTCRKLAGVPSGAIKLSDFYGKASSVEYKRHLVISRICPGDFSFNLPNAVIDGYMEVKVDFAGYQTSPSHGAERDGQLRIAGNFMSGTGVVTRTYKVASGTKSIYVDFIMDAFIPRSSSDHRGYNYFPVITVYFTGTVIK